jgi:hypothetical protein
LEQWAIPAPAVEHVFGGDLATVPAVARRRKATIISLLIQWLHSYPEFELFNAVCSTAKLSFRPGCGAVKRQPNTIGLTQSGLPELLSYDTPTSRGVEAT